MGTKVNAGIFFFTGHNKIIWIMAMAVAMFILLYSFSELFVRDNRSESNLIIAALVCVFPYSILNTAGWISTCSTYFIPIALGFYSLIPIKRIVYKENIKWWEYPLFFFAALYGANNEQMMVVLLSCYAVASVYFMINKHIRPILFIQLTAVLVNCYWVIRSPGNAFRKELGYGWFPTFDMMSCVDKFDIGFTTGLRWLFFGGNIFVIVALMIIGYVCSKKCTNNTVKTLTLIPPVFCILFGPLNSVSIEFLSGLRDLATEPNFYGLVTEANKGELEFFVKYLVWTSMLTIVLMSILVSMNSLKGILSSTVLFTSGIASRIALGFTTSIYISGERINTVMSFCTIAVACQVFSCGLGGGLIGEKSRRIISSFMTILLFIGLINVILLQ